VVVLVALTFLEEKLSAENRRPAKQRCGSRRTSSILRLRTLK
jgi:hypothetical protein